MQHQHTAINGTSRERTLGLKHWPQPERPREKLLRHGPAALSDSELLALFIRSGTAGRNAIDLAREAIVKTGGLRALLELSPEDLCRLPGFGPTRYVELQACLEIGRRHLEAAINRGDPLTTTAATANFLIAKLRHLTSEVFACLFLDIQHRVIAFEVLFSGTVNATNVQPREVLRRAIAHNATAVILSHNHPSGASQPSDADRNVTSQLIEVLTLLDIEVLDHLVIGESDYTSFRDSKMM